MVFILLATFTAPHYLFLSPLLLYWSPLPSYSVFLFLSFFIFLPPFHWHRVSLCRLSLQSPGVQAFATVFNFAVLLTTSRSAMGIPVLLSILVTWVFPLFSFRNNLFLGLVLCMCLCLWVGVCARELQVPKDAGSPVAMVASSYDLAKVSARTRTPNLCRNSACSQLLGHPSSPCFLLLVLLITITKFIDFF